MLGIKQIGGKPYLTLSCMVKSYAALIAPIFDLIDSPEIIISPEPDLFLTPFASLKDDNGKYLSETLRVRLIPSLTTLKLIHDSPASYHSQSGALIVGDPAVGPIEINGCVKTLDPLRKAREEAQMVSRLVGVPCLIGEEATKEDVLRRIQEVSLVHIAAHGDEDTGEIALSPNRSVVGVPKKEDVILTMNEIAQVGIRAKLVVLSCCHSAPGKISKAEGVVGIARAFLGSGARSVLVSLWAVDDGATKTFMNIFYKFLIREKLSASESLHQTMQKMRESELYGDREHWAPFVLLGDDVTVTF
ncbi:tetratricopeptide repeat protein 28-like [Stylophora pistillata]|uniref:tetratricopeptide repeat protein 28-like n=1 Tax=Stylophora pistillata TaxID=50429 RepID=UPI000C03B0EE|nr:tetratricopeptide repeat protein 28-like [Stylophora pistillata]